MGVPSKITTYRFIPILLNSECRRMQAVTLIVSSFNLLLTPLKHCLVLFGVLTIKHFGKEVPSSDSPDEEGTSVPKRFVVRTPKRTRQCFRAVKRRLKEETIGSFRAT